MLFNIDNLLNFGENMGKQTRAILAIIKGRVQGVAFRWYAMKKAVECDLTGYVKNREDQSLEIFIQGNTFNLDYFIKWCHIGPPSARVDRVEIMEKDPEGSFDNFEIYY